MSAAETTEALRVALRARYADEAWKLYGRAPGDVLLEEVQLDGRSADAIRIGCWKSRGYALEGFELKATRSDWLRELKEPAKADTIARFLDRWWIVAPTGIVNRDELPVSWGLMQLRADGKLVVSVQATKRKPDPPDRYVVAMLARAGFMQSRAELTRERERIGKQIDERVEQRLKLRDPDEQLRSRVEELERAISEFEAASGIRLHEGWHGPGKVGQVVRWALEHQRDPRWSAAIERAARLLTNELRQLEELREALAAAIPSQEEMIP